MNITNTLLASAFTLFAAGSSFGQVVAWDFKNPDSVGTIGNTVTETSTPGGISLGIRGFTFSGTASAGTFANSNVSQWTPGLGMQLSGDDYHQLDNSGLDEFLLFKFDKQFKDIKFSFNPAEGNTAVDGDVSYWVGNTVGNVSLAGKTTAQLTALGFQAVQTVNRGTGTTTFDVTLTNIPAGGINTVLLGGPIGQEDDVYKISGVSGTVVPEPSGVLLIGATGLLAFARRRRR